MKFRVNVYNFWKMSSRENLVLAECTVHSGKSKFCKIAFRGNVHLAKCTFGQMYILASVISGK